MGDNMTIKIGINGFGRIGRLVLRASAAWGKNNGIEFVHINDPAGDAPTHAHLLNFDSVHGRPASLATVNNGQLAFGDNNARVSTNTSIEQSDWSGCDIVLESSGRFRSMDSLNAYLEQGVKRVVVSAPVKDDGALNIVMGVNQECYQPTQHKIVTAASCTTNCLAPAVKVIHENLGISHGTITTIHSVTNTQTILDAPHKDLRRARACASSLIPTTTGSATAITDIFPELTGKLDGHAVRVPLSNASLTDCVFELKKPTTAEQVNALFKEASNTHLQGILGYEERPLVSIDYRTDPRSCIVDAPSTMVVNGTQLKLYLWYDNEWGYANRTAELIRWIAEQGF